MSRYRFAILSTREPMTYRGWVVACRRHGVDFDVIDLLKADWLERILAFPYDCLLVRPDARLAWLKELYDERLYTLAVSLGLRLYPTYPELRIYENKRALAYWLQANRIPHPSTRVYYDREEAHEYASSCTLPVVVKARLGAAGSGVEVLSRRDDARAYVRKAFSWWGVRRRFGPNFRQTGLLRRAGRSRDLAWLRSRIASYANRFLDAERGCVIFQEFVPHEFEWRVVRIGPSHFAHKKLAVSGFASGSKRKAYDNPPLELLDFVRCICERHGFVSQAVDLFPTHDGSYLVNELQAIFGQSDPFQMKVDGRVGRYVFAGSRWRFEAGDFNGNECFDLRVEHAISLLDAERAGTTGSRVATTGVSV